MDHKKILVFMCLALLLVGTVSAFEFDNIKQYDEETQIITIKNSILGISFLDLDTVATIQLTTPLNNKVHRGYGKVAEFIINTNEDYLEALKEVELFDRTDGDKEFYRDYDYKVKGYEDIKVDDYKNVIVGYEINGTAIIENQVVGSHLETREKWITLSSLDFKENDKLTIGIFTDVQKGDRVEWIPNFFGVRIDEWAAWTEAMNVDLLHYYDLEEGAGTLVIDKVAGARNGTTRTDSYWTGGRVGGGLRGLTHGTFNISSIDASISVNTICFWANDTDIAADHDKTIMTTVSDTNAFIQQSGDTYWWTMSAVSWKPTIPTENSVNQWRHFCLVVNSTGQYLYINGTYKGNSGLSNPTYSETSLHFGDNPTYGPQYMNGAFDEIGIWNRTLTQSEITDLYNGGAGITFGEVVSLDVSLDSPANSTSFNNASIDFNFALTPTSGYNTTNATLEIYYENGSIWATNNTVIGNGSIINSTKTISGWVGGTYYWNVRGCTEDELTGAFEECSYATNNYTLTWLPFTVESENHTEILRETDYSTFLVNITTSVGYTVQSGRLVYNNSQYPPAQKNEVDSNTEQLVQSIYVPQGIKGFVNESRDFYWNVSVTNEATGVTASFTTDTYNQTVSELPFELCNSDYNIPVLNFTLIDETNNVIINATSNATTFQATFDYGTSSGNLMKNYSIDNLTVGNNTFDFCTANYTKPFKANAEIFYTAVDYVNKDYFLNNASLTNTTNSINLYLLPETEALEFFISVTEDLDALVGATITISKYFVGEGVYKTVEIDTTDDDGQITAYLDLDKKYRFTITSGATVLGIQEKDATCEAAPCEILLELTSEGSNMFDVLNNTFAQNIAHNLSFNQNNKMVTWDFIDTTGLATYFRMYVYRSYSNQSSTLIHDKTLYTSSGQITYNASEYNTGDFMVKVYVSRSPEKLIDFITFLLNENAEELGVIGLLAGFMFMMVIIFGLSMKPSILVFSVPLGLSLIKLMGLFSLNTTSLAVMWLLAFVAIWAMNK